MLDVIGRDQIVNIHTHSEKEMKANNIYLEGYSFNKNSNKEMTYE